MIFLEPQVKVWLYTKPTDMRKSFDGLSSLVRTQLADDPLSGHLFMFVNRRKTHTKILYFDRTGYCVWAKRLEQGQFNFRNTDTLKKSLSMTDLKLILEGIKVEKSRRYKRFNKAIGY